MVTPSSRKLHIKSSNQYNNMAESNMPPLYLAHMPDVFGHGLMAFSVISRAEAISKLRAAYLEIYMPFSMTSRADTFHHQWEHFGGVVHEININKVYDSF